MINLDLSKLSYFHAISNFERHDEMKSSLLKKIECADNIPMKWVDGQYNDSIHRCDWQNGGDFSRPWIEPFASALYEHLTLIGEQFHLRTTRIHRLWYQQYQTNDLHGWHVHGGCQFTGVYYLHQPEDAPKTMIIDPLTQGVQTLDIKEGDILIFPSSVVHTSQRNKSDKIKTILSFNFDYEEICVNSLLEYNKYLN